MDFRYGTAFAIPPPEAYERLLLDVMLGDPTLYTRTDAVESAWRFCTAILDACEDAAIAAGFTRLEMGATLTGVPFYAARGYRASDRFNVPLTNGETLPIVRMKKTLPGA